jgi:YesN/AraC family two-component response regulator
MFNLLIVDDKKTVRDGLKSYVNWQELGFKVTADFSSASEAIRYIESECIDVLLTDIVMPDMNGLELIKEVKLINPQIKVLILSAYEKFEYAQEAVRLGAFSYLTKPVDFDKLKTEFTIIKHILENENIIRQQKNEYKDIAREQFLNNLVNNHYSTSETILSRAAAIEIPLDNSNFCIVRIINEKISLIEEESDRNNFQLLKSKTAFHANKLMNDLGRAYVFSGSLAEVSVLFFPNTVENLKKDIETCKDSINSTLITNVLIGVGRVYSNITSASISYSEAGKALEYHIVKQKNNVLFYEDIIEFFKGKTLITHDIEEMILNYLSQQNENLLKEYILSIVINAFTAGQSNTNILYDVCIEILLIINKFLTTNVDNEKFTEQNGYLSIKTLLQKQNFAEIKGFMSEYVKDCFNIIRKYNDKSAGLIIEHVKKYIHEHYNEEISLNKLSEIAYVNPVYLSRLFKEKTGENFIDYLTRVRIDRAKKYLEDLSLRIYDITEMVGYESRKHFGKTFKDITGMSPKEYRNKLS